MEELVNVTESDERYEITPTDDWEPVASTVVAAGIAQVKGVAPEEVEPALPAYTDPDALDTFLTDSSESSIYVQFSAWGHLVTIDADLTVTMKPLTDHKPAVQIPSANVDSNNQSHS